MTSSHWSRLGLDNAGGLLDARCRLGVSGQRAVCADLPPILGDGLVPGKTKHNSLNEKENVPCATTTPNRTSNVGDTNAGVMGYEFM